MDLWQILVLGVVRMGLDLNYDRLCDTANHHTLIRQIMGIYPVCEETKKFAVAKDSTFSYKSGADVVSTWKKTGWVAPSEYRTDYLFGSKK